jgi:hypothetical protein
MLFKTYVVKGIFCCAQAGPRPQAGPNNARADVGHAELGPACASTRWRAQKQWLLRSQRSKCSKRQIIKLRNAGHTAHVRLR